MINLANKRIIVTFLMHLGDLTLTTPFLSVLRKAAPGAHITYLVDEKLKDVVLNNPNIDEVMTIDKKGKDNSISGLRKKAQDISAKKFDVLINLHPNERCSFIDFLAKVPLKVGFSHFLFRPFLDEVTRLDRSMHAADMYIDVLAQLGVTNLKNNGLEIFPGEKEKTVADQFWLEENLAVNDKLVGFNIGSAVETKRWAPSRFAEVADTLEKKGYKTVFFGGPMDETMVKEATDLMKTKTIIATGKFSIGELAAAMRRCDLIITNDSGPMHVAISQKVPIVAMYGPSSPILYGPYTKKATIVTAIPKCDGCKNGMKHTCVELKNRCMTDLKVEQVVEAALAWLEKKQG